MKLEIDIEEKDLLKKKEDSSNSTGTHRGQYNSNKINNNDNTEQTQDKINSKDSNNFMEFQNKDPHRKNSFNETAPSKKNQLINHNADDVKNEEDIYKMSRYKTFQNKKFIVI